MAKRRVSVGVEITGTAKGYKVAAEDAARATAKLEREARAKSREMEQSFKNVTMAVAKIGGAILIARQAFDVFARVMKTTEGASDSFEEAMGGVKEGIFEVSKALSTSDFSHFFKNIKEGIERGKEITKALDDLADKSAYNDYIIQGLKSEKALLQETVKNRQLELSVRADAADKVKDIAEKIQKREVDLALKLFNIEKRSWEGEK